METGDCCATSQIRNGACDRIRSRACSTAAAAPAAVTTPASGTVVHATTVQMPQMDGCTLQAALPMKHASRCCHIALWQSAATGFTLFCLAGEVEEIIPVFYKL